MCYFKIIAALSLLSYDVSSFIIFAVSNRLKLVVFYGITLCENLFCECRYLNSNKLKYSAVTLNEFRKKNFTSEQNFTMNKGIIKSALLAW